MAQRQVYQRVPAPCGARLVAGIVDYCILSSILGCILYPLWKDGIRDGQSFGRGITGLRVVKYDTGEPIGIGGSIMRNCIGGIVDSIACGGCISLLLLLFSEEKRTIKDMVAGTMVIKE